MAVPVHVVIPTHTTRHLYRTVLGYARQEVPPTTITVTCDTDAPEIGLLLERVAKETGTTITHVYRARHPEPRRSQNRNNGIRSLIQRGLGDDDLLVLVDGDCIPASDFVASHIECSRTADFVLGNYILLDEATTNEIPTDETMHEFLKTAPDRKELERMHALERKARTHRVLRKFRLTKAHKPKLLGANTSVRAASILAVNGFDEEYMDWGYEDDDLGRRLHRSGAKAAIGITRTVLYHQWHPTAKGTPWKSGGVAQRFNSRLPNRCRHGIEHPFEQHPVHERELTP